MLDTRSGRKGRGVEKYDVHVSEQGRGVRTTRGGLVRGNVYDKETVLTGRVGVWRRRYVRRVRREEVGVEVGCVGGVRNKKIPEKVEVQKYENLRGKR